MTGSGRAWSGKVIEGVFTQALADSLSAELRLRLVAEGVNVDGPVLESYPAEVFMRALEIAAAEIFPGKSQGEALRALGVKVVLALRARGAIKGPVLMVAKVMGPKRVLKQLVQQAHKGNTYLEVTLREVSHGAQLELNDGSLAEFLAGALEGLLGALGARSPIVEPRIDGPHRAVLHAHWG